MVDCRNGVTETMFSPAGCQTHKGVSLDDRQTVLLSAKYESPAMKEKAVEGETAKQETKRMRQKSGKQECRCCLVVFRKDELI